MVGHLSCGGCELNLICLQVFQLSIFCRSTRNTRIERVWVEVGTQFARRWRAFFTRLESLHHLNHQNPTHLWLIHFLFLDDINADCEEFRSEWNLHPIAGVKTKGQSPAVRTIERAYE